MRYMPSRFNFISFFGKGHFFGFWRERSMGNGEMRGEEEKNNIFSFLLFLISVVRSYFPTRDRDISKRKRKEYNFVSPHKIVKNKKCILFLHEFLWEAMSVRPRNYVKEERRHPRLSV